MLARKVITRSGRGFRAQFPSAKLGRMVAGESLLEQDAILLFEFSPGVVSYQEQPTLIRYFDGAEFREYYPDFEVVLVGDRRLYIEVKPEKKLKKPKVAAKYRAIAQHFADLGQEFRIVTERECRREPLRTNLRELTYINGRRSQSLPAVVELSRVLGEAPVAFSAAVAHFGRATVLRLIVQGDLHCDLECPLQGGTPIGVVKGVRHATLLF